MHATIAGSRSASGRARVVAWSVSNAALGLLLPDVPFVLFGVIDGVLKIFVGVGSLGARPVRSAPSV